MRLAMAIDLRKCIGCHACSVACKSNNNLPRAKWWNRVETDGGASMDTARGTYPNDLHWSFRPINCQHCSSPACMAVCPAEAIGQREDGIIVQDNEKCIGCKLCVSACPYGVRVFNDEEPEYEVDFPLGDYDAPFHKANVVEKCTYCVNRVDRNEKPACMELCLGRARYWGDIDNPDSEISLFLRTNESRVTRLLEEKGTEPNCYYVS